MRFKNVREILEAATSVQAEQRHIERTRTLKERLLIRWEVRVVMADDILGALLIFLLVSGLIWSGFYLS